MLWVGSLDSCLHPFLFAILSWDSKQPIQKRPMGHWLINGNDMEYLVYQANTVYIYISTGISNMFVCCAILMGICSQDFTKHVRSHQWKHPESKDYEQLEIEARRTWLQPTMTVITKNTSGV